MAYNALVSILCPDRVGLIAAVTGMLHDLGANLADTTFAVLGQAAEFTGICELPDEQDPETVRAALTELPELDAAEVLVRAFGVGPRDAALGRATHRVECLGQDRPGLVARLTEVFGDYDANIVRMNTERVAGSDGDDYVIRFAVAIPDKRVDACLATLSNTAAELRQTFRWRAVDPDRIDG